jgi:hypothetical protein
MAGSKDPAVFLDKGNLIGERALSDRRAVHILSVENQPFTETFAGPAIELFGGNPLTFPRRPR